MKKLIVILITIVFCLLTTNHLYATTIMSFEYVYSGTTPTGNSPFLTAAFSNQTDIHGNVTGVLLTLSTKFQTGFVTEWDFNFNPKEDLSGLKIEALSGPAPKYVRIEENAFKAGSDGKYDISFLFYQANGNRFWAGSTATFLITGNGISESDFYYPSTSGSNFISAAHVQGLKNGASAWIADPPQTPVPEPSTLLLLGSGLAVMAAYRRKVRKE